MDKEAKKKMKKGNQIMLVLFMIIGVICGIMLVRLDVISVKDTLSGKDVLYMYALLAVCIYPAAVLQIAIHEAGHLVFGLLTGYQFTSFRIGNFMWIKESGNLKFRKMSLAGTGGQCLMSPPELIDGKMPFVLYNIGGSLMNLAASLFFAGVYFLCKELSYLPVFFIIMSIIGVGFALINGIPMQLGTVNNDGYNAITLGDSPAAIHSFWVQMKTNELSAKGIRIKDMPEEWFYVPQDKELNNSMIATMAVFYENRLMDMHSFQEAVNLIDKLQSMETAIVGLYDGLLVCDRMYCELIDGREAEIIEKLHTKEQSQFMKQMRKFPAVLRTEYTLALLYEKDVSKAEIIQKQFEKCAKTYPYACDIESEKELMEIANMRK